MIKDKEVKGTSKFTIDAGKMFAEKDFMQNLNSPRDKANNVFY